MSLFEREKRYLKLSVKDVRPRMCRTKLLNRRLLSDLSEGIFDWRKYTKREFSEASYKIMETVKYIVRRYETVRKYVFRPRSCMKTRSRGNRSADIASIQYTF